MRRPKRVTAAAILSNLDSPHKPGNGVYLIALNGLIKLSYEQLDALYVMSKWQVMSKWRANERKSSS